MKPSLSASALKYIALAAMLLDHMAYYLSLPLPLRWVGRLAAPIFLFFVVEGFCHTRRFGRYLLRMYAVAMGMGLVNTLLARYAAGFRPDGITPQNGICATFFLLLLMLRARRPADAARALRRPRCAGTGIPHRRQSLPGWRGCCRHCRYRCLQTPSR